MFFKTLDTHDNTYDYSFKSNNALELNFVKV